MISRWPVAAALSACLACAGGESPPSGERRSDALDAVATRALGEGFPGVTIARGSASGEIATGAAGLADRASGVAMAPDAAIHAASTTKAVTAAAVLRLIDRGTLTLDTRLPEVLAEELWAGVPHADEITVRQLLLHTSGLYSPNNNPTYLARYLGPERKQKPFWRPEEIVAFAADPAGFVDTTDAQEQSDGAAGLITTTADMVRFARALVDGDLLSPASRRLVLEVADQVDPPSDGETLGVLRAYPMPYGAIVTAEGDGPGTHALWAWHPESNRIVAAAVNQFGRWTESDYLLNTLVPAALEAEVE